jgi:hypothetical protein
MPKLKRPRRRAYMYSNHKGLARVAMSSVNEALYDDPLVSAEQRLIDQVQRYADGGPRPADYLEFEIDPRLGDMWFRRAAVAAIAVQMRLMARALGKNPSAAELREGNLAARIVEDRLFGKPIEKMAVAGRVRIEFGGLNPDVFPQEPKEAEAEIVEIPTDAGTEAPEEEDE